MALSRSQKDALVEHYEAGLAQAAHAFVLEFKGISVPEVTALRAKVRAAGGRYEVVKNTLAKRVAEGRPLAEVASHFQGPTAIVHTNHDPVAVAKALEEFAKDAPSLTFKAGLVDGRVVAAEQIAEIAKLPSREALVAKLVFLLQSPITRFVRTLAAVPRDFVLVLEQVRQKKEAQG